MSAGVRLAAVATAAVLLWPAVAQAALRTAQTTVRGPDKTSAEFPGLQTVAVRYDDASGQLDVVATLRSAMVDPAQTSALRSTQIEVSLGDIYGDRSFTDSCDWGTAGRQLQLRLGSGTAGVGGDGLFDEPDDITVPLVVSEDRRTVAASFPAGPATTGWNPICLHASMTGPRGMAEGAPVDFTAHRMFDGFDYTDGSIGIAAEQDLLSLFSGLVNSLLPEKRQVGRVPGSKANCTPERGSAFVTCRASTRIPVFVGRPTLTISGERVFRLVHSRDIFGDSGRLLRWRQSMPFRVFWKRCSLRIDVRLAGAKRSCAVRGRWTSGVLGDRVAEAVIRRGKRTGRAPRRR